MHKYRVLEKLGEGAQGIVSKAILLKDGADQKQADEDPVYVAMKKMKISDQQTGVSNETIREIMCLREIKHDNIINIIDIFGREDHIYVIMPFMVTDLENIIRNDKILIRPSDIKAYMKMLLDGMAYIHDFACLLHRDIKPSNCLISSDNRLLVSDFGLAREFGSPTRVLSYQACTIWYRAPELLFGSNFYSNKMDMWSVGCVFGELMLRIPIFPGRDDIDQLSKIFGVLGTPPEMNELSKDSNSSSVTGVTGVPGVGGANVNSTNCGSGWKYSSVLAKYRKFEKRPKFNLKMLFSAASDDQLDLFDKLCMFDPNERIDAASALKHKYFQNDPKPTELKDLPDIRKVKAKK